MTLLELLPRTERETLKFRLLALLVVAIIVAFRVRETPILPLAGLVGAYLAYSVLLRLLLIPRFSSYGLLGAMLLVDAGTLLSAISLVGLDTPVVMLLSVAVVYYGLYLGYVGGLLMATLVSFGFVALVYASGRLEAMANLVAIQVPSSFLMALLVGYLAQARLRESEERRSYQQLVQAETQGRRLLELARSLESGAWEGLAPSELARAAAAIARLPWAALLVPDEAQGSLALAGATYAPASQTPVPLENAPFLDAAWREAREVEHAGSWEGPPVPWAPAAGRPGYLWATPLGGGDGVLCVMGPAGAALDEERREALRTFAPLAGRVLQVHRLFLRVERRGRDLVEDLRSTVESSDRLVQVQPRHPLQFGLLVIEPARERVRVGTRAVHLSRAELDLLYALASNAGSVLNAETLLRTVWGPDYVPQGKPVDVAIHRLRRRLAALPGGSQMVRTVRGRGYTFSRADAAAVGEAADRAPSQTSPRP